MNNLMNDLFKMKACDNKTKEMIPFNEIRLSRLVHDKDNETMKDIVSNAVAEDITFLPFSGLTSLDGSELYAGDLIRVGDNGIWEVSLQDGMFKANQFLKSLPLVSMIEGEKRDPEGKKITAVGNSYGVDKELYKTIREDAYNVLKGNISKTETVVILDNYLHEALTKFGDSPETIQYLIDIAGYEKNQSEDVDLSILEKYNSFLSFSSREGYLADEADANIATLQAILNDESDNEMARFISMLIEENGEPSLPNSATPDEVKVFRLLVDNEHDVVVTVGFYDNPHGYFIGHICDDIEGECSDIVLKDIRHRLTDDVGAIENLFDGNNVSNGWFTVREPNDSPIEAKLRESFAKINDVEEMEGEIAIIQLGMAQGGGMASEGARSLMDKELSLAEERLAELRDGGALVDEVKKRNANSREKKKSDKYAQSPKIG